MKRETAKNLLAGRTCHNCYYRHKGVVSVFYVCLYSGHKEELPKKGTCNDWYIGIGRYNATNI